MAWPLISRMHSAVARAAAPRVPILRNRPVDMRALVDELTELVDRIAPAPGGAAGDTLGEAPAGLAAWRRSVHVGTSAPEQSTKGRFPMPQPGDAPVIDALSLLYAEKFRLAVWCATAAALCVGPRLIREESVRERCLRSAEALAGSALAASSAYMRLGVGERAQLLMEILAPALELHAFGTAILQPEISAQLYAIALSTSDITCSAYSLMLIVPALVAHLNLLLRFLTEELRAMVHLSADASV